MGHVQAVYLEVYLTVHDEPVNVIGVTFEGVWFLDEFGFAPELESIFSHVATGLWQLAEGSSFAEAPEDRPVGLGVGNEQYVQVGGFWCQTSSDWAVAWFPSWLLGSFSLVFICFALASHQSAFAFAGSGHWHALPLLPKSQQPPRYFQITKCNDGLSSAELELTVLLILSHVSDPVPILVSMDELLSAFEGNSFSSCCCSLKSVGVCVVLCTGKGIPGTNARLSACSLGVELSGLSGDDHWDFLVLTIEDVSFFLPKVQLLMVQIKARMLFLHEIEEWGFRYGRLKGGEGASVGLDDDIVVEEVDAVNEGKYEQYYSPDEGTDRCHKDIEGFGSDVRLQRLANENQKRLSTLSQERIDSHDGWEDYFLSQDEVDAWSKDAIDKSIVTDPRDTDGNLCADQWAWIPFTGYGYGVKWRTIIKGLGQDLTYGYDIGYKFGTIIAKSPLDILAMEQNHTTVMDKNLLIIRSASYTLLSQML
ncbi:hypothetical protein ARMSODRAFT_972723 [Armillaria solidipes]|uniref:Uncharacterized protein n=1 Tax=Armillaria solidipes TaxID=1076256 RepID=A0A2H3BUG1_9AGAR|nr:hypothetical protein ARMSODRAFT_972723 [Armillaria solidipes]